MPRVFAAAFLAVCSASLAQSPLGSPAPPTGATGATAPTGAGPATGGGTGPVSVRLEDLPVNIRLGARVETVRRGWPCIPTLVLVPDEASYIQAISHWKIAGRFPVLIDDGSLGAAEDIARFAHAFSPKATVRWDAHAQAFGSPEERRAAVEHALFGLWSGTSAAPAPINSQDDLLAFWARNHIVPPGIVIADAGDTAWPAALALAAGRAQPILWTHVAGGVNAAMPLDQFVALADAVDATAEKTGLPWRAIGDALDGVTICANCPIKVQLDANDSVATTDLLGRLAGEKVEGKPDPKTPRQTGKRWAWCGEVFGTSERAAYSAMCSLFLAPTRAWLFDGYPDTKPWSDYDCTTAAKALRQVGLDVTLDDTPRGGEQSWRLRADAGVDAGLIMVNSKGSGDEFNLEPGQCRPSDVPFLHVPAIVYFVHSWSAVMPGERSTVAGRWLERGAYAYLGSTSEPYLQSFVPTPAVAARLCLGVPWGAAVRFDDTPPPAKPDERVVVPPAWKLATIGDPLITLGPAPAVSTVPLALDGSVALEDDLKARLAAKDFGGAIRTLAMLGRDKDAARLALAVLSDDPKSFTPRVAAESILPLMRVHDAAGLVRAYAQLTPNLASDPVLRDALWHACDAELGSTPNEAMVDVLRSNLRSDQIGRDAAELSRPLARFYGPNVGLAMLNDAKAKCQTDYDRAHVEAAMKKLGVR